MLAVAAIVLSSGCTDSENCLGDRETWYVSSLYLEVHKPLLGGSWVVISRGYK